MSPDVDALNAITALLARTGARSLAIVAHGEPGVIRIGSEFIDKAVLAARAGLLQEWGVEQISLYACAVGADAGFVAELERLTGARVAAATGQVGAVELGGSWELSGGGDDVWVVGGLVGYGGILGSEFIVNTYKADNQFNSSVTALSDGGFVVTWQSDGVDGAGGSGFGISARIFEADPVVAPTDTFQDVDAGDTLTYSATLKNGDLLPDWLSLDLTTGKFSGKPADDDSGKYNINITATDTAGATATSVFNLKVLDTIQQVGSLPCVDLREVIGTASCDSKVSASAAYDNHGGFYTVDDATGKIGNLKPSDPGYAAAALKRAVLNIGKNQASGNYQLAGGSLLAPYLIANGTVDDFLNKAEADRPHAYFNYAEANADKLEHIKSIGSNSYACEDMFGGGDKDFNDFNIQMSFKPA